MRRLLTLLLIICSGAAADAQTITSVYNQDSCGTHGFGYITNITNGNQQYRLEHNFGNGFIDTFVLYYGWMSPGYSAEFNYAYPAAGTYTAKGVLLSSTNQRLDSATQTVNTGLCILFSGRMFLDQNSNCTFNAGIDSTLYSPVQIKVDSANVTVDTIWAYGLWSYARHNPYGTPVTYKFTVLNPPAGTASCLTGNSLTVAYPTAPLSGNNFGFTCTNSAFDASGMYTAFMRISTAGGSWINGWYTNDGCAPLSGTVTMKVSPKYTINAAGIQPAPVSVSGNLITWNYSGLHLYNFRNFYIPIVPTTVYTTNDTGCNTLTVNPLAGDLNPANNVVSRCDSLRGAFDPNDKAVTPVGNVTVSTRLTYLINFENLGNDTAFNVHVLDTLSPTLDPASFQLLGASDPMRVMELAGPAGTKILKFDFPNIRLADKTKPLYNKGFVRFSIKTKTGLVNGTNIPNRAGIYFDFNPVVMTNTALNKIGTPQLVSVLDATPRNSLYPNPATTSLTITNADGALTSATLVNGLGQTLRRWNLSAGDNSFTIEELPAGFYVVQLHSADGIQQTEKLQKL